MKYILKGLIQRDDTHNPLKGLNNQFLKKQLSIMNIVRSGRVDSSNFEESPMIDTKTRTKLHNLQTPLQTIFGLLKNDYIKKDKALLRNISLLAQQIFQHISIAKEDLEN